MTPWDLGIGEVRDACEIVARSPSVRGNARWTVRCACGTDHTEDARYLRQSGLRFWLCTACRKLATNTRRAILNAWPVGSVVGTWRILAMVVDGRLSARCECIHCGVIRNVRPHDHGAKGWHAGCTAPCPPKRYARKTTRDNVTPDGDDPLWAQWSAMLHMNDPECAGWSNGRIENIKAWRSNQLAASRVMTIEERASLRYTGRSVVP